MNKSPMVAIYARVSSQRQADEGTIDSQRQAIIDRVNEDGLTIRPEHEFCDDGYSGAELLRPALERLRDVVATATIDLVYIHSPDRLSRKMAHQAILLDEFSKHNCKVVFLNQKDVSESPEANLLLQMQGMIAEYEREKILERTRRGRLHAAKRGDVAVFSCAPYGYVYIKKSRDSAARWEIDPVRSEHVQWMFQWVANEQCSLGEVTRRLEGRGIITATGQSQWDRSTICGILRNPAYHGHAVFGKKRLAPRKPGKRAKRGDPQIPRQAKVSIPTDPNEQIVISVPAIVELPLFERVGRQMDENLRRQRERNAGAKYLLSGLTICGECGAAFCSRAVGNHTYYRCIGGDKYRKRKSGTPLCDNSSVKGREFEEVVWQDICRLLSEPKRLRDELERRRLQTNDNYVSSTESVEKTVAQLRTRLDRMIDGYELGLIEKEEFERRVVPLREYYNREVAALESLRGAAAETLDVESVSAMLESLGEEVSSRLADAEWELKRSLAKLLIERIEIHRNEIRIVYKVPPNPFVLAPANRGFLQHWLSRIGVGKLGFPSSPPSEPYVRFSRIRLSG